MNKQFILGNWEKVKGSLKQKYAQLTDNDLMYVKGKEQELLGRIEKKLGLTKGAVELFLKAHTGKTEQQTKKKH
jgi:uncharacterized protein YjbJ (UPF0337 family)